MVRPQAWKTPAGEVTVGVKTYTATVTDNAWSVTVPAEAVGDCLQQVLCL
ncbi:hypothetical protein [Acinetobacter portensis]|nr:hypothetical protein [Acinetobacter portensis]